MVAMETDATDKQACFILFKKLIMSLCMHLLCPLSIIYVGALYKDQFLVMSFVLGMYSP